MAKTFYYLLKETRPRQWLKNVIVFTSVFMTGQLFNLDLVLRSFLAFLAFCAASSSIYILNDLSDIEKDRLHPFKKNRPIAAGKISKSVAVITAGILIILALLISAKISAAFVVVLMVFFGLHVFYSLKLKNIMLIDILTIASGFVLRVFGGEIATGYHINFWLFLAVISAALFLAVGKRRSELTLMSGWGSGLGAKTRATLSHYSEKMLDVYLSMFANSTWLTYAFYTFLTRPPVLRKSINNLIDENSVYLFQDRKWLIVTIPVAIYGIMRYLQLIYERNEGESPEKVYLSDKPLIFTSALLACLLFLIFYVIGK